MNLCPWDSPLYFIYSSNVPSLLYYSHFTTIIIGLLIGFFVFFKSGKSVLGKNLLYISVLFSAWTFIDLILWATNRPDLVLFFWSLQILIEPLLFIFSFYLIFYFVKQKHLSFFYSLIIALFYLPIVFFLNTDLSLSGIYLSDCSAVEGPISKYYVYLIEFVFIILIFCFSFLNYKDKRYVDYKKQIKIFSIGVVLFLLSFIFGNIIGSFLDNWVLAQAGLIGMPIFATFLAYLILKFNLLNVKLFTTQIFVWTLILLIGSQFFFIKVTVNFILTGITFIIAIVLGNFLIRSVKLEIEQKEYLQVLNKELKEIVKQRESLVHLITHKVKGAFTRSKYIFAEMISGTFGEINKEVSEIAKKGFDSDNEGIQTVDIVLNSFNLQSGNVKYEMKNFSFKEIVLKVIDEKRSRILAKGLDIESDIADGDFVISGDAFWLKEVINNLIENSLRYSLKGLIFIKLEYKDDKVLLSVKDEGVGLTEDVKKNLFTEGGRGKDSIKMNVDSTGFGLFSAKLIIESHHGRIWAESEGENKGSTFFVELNKV